MNEIVEWSKRFYTLGAGNDRSGTLDFVESAPWGVKVCADRLSPFVNTQTVAKSTQSSGTITGEAISAFTLARRTGNMLINCQSDEDAKDFARTRMMPRLKRIPEMACILPGRHAEGRHNMGGQYIVFPDATFLLIQGPGENNAQSKTASSVWNDEPYLYAPGRVVEFSNRVGAVWNGKVLNTSVGGEVGSDIDQLYVEGTQEEWHHRCLSHACGKLFLPTWWKIRYGKFVYRWDRAMEAGEETDWTRLAETIRIVCPHCGEAHPDTRAVRRQLTAYGRADYLAANPKGNPQKPSYRWNKQSPWGYRLAELVERFLKAQWAKKRGNTSLIKKFVTHDQAETYNRADHESAGTGLTVPSADYDFDDVGTEEFRRRFPVRVMGCDRQLGHREVVIRAYGPGGSRLVWTGRANDKRHMRQIQLDYGVRDALVFQDCAWEDKDVYAECREFKWTAIYGDPGQRDEWAHAADALHPVPTMRPYRRDYVEGCWRVTWSGPSIKNTVYLLRTRQGQLDADQNPLSEYWGIPKNAPQDYLNQINQRPIIKADGRLEWPRGNDHRHDAECFCEVGRQLLADGLFPAVCPNGKFPNL